jgi:hypothetical protein
MAGEVQIGSRPCAVALRRWTLWSVAVLMQDRVECGHKRCPSRGRVGCFPGHSGDSCKAIQGHEDKGLYQDKGWMLTTCNFIYNAITVLWISTNLCTYKLMSISMLKNWLILINPNINMHAVVLCFLNTILIFKSDPASHGTYRLILSTRWFTEGLFFDSSLDLDIISSGLANACRTTNTVYHLTWAWVVTAHVTSTVFWSRMFKYICLSWFYDMIQNIMWSTGCSTGESEELKLYLIGIQALYTWLEGLGYQPVNPTEIGFLHVTMHPFKSLRRLGTSWRNRGHAINPN